MCGEKKPTTPVTVRCIGSPPHVRGKDVELFALFVHHGITPACAGKRLRFLPACLHRQDHPRVCGEKSLLLGSSGSMGGSPPHMRGKADVFCNNCELSRITPAHAGKSYSMCFLPESSWDHPRTCGEKSGAEHFPYKKVIRSFTCGSACRSGRIMPGISSISVSSAHDGHQPKAVGLAASHALTQQCPELLCIGHLQNALIGHC